MPRAAARQRRARVLLSLVLMFHVRESALCMACLLPSHYDEMRAAHEPGKRNADPRKDARCCARVPALPRDTLTAT